MCVCGVYEYVRAHECVYLFVCVCVCVCVCVRERAYAAVCESVGLDVSVSGVRAWVRAEWVRACLVCAFVCALVACACEVQPAESSYSHLSQSL